MAAAERTDAAGHPPRDRGRRPLDRQGAACRRHGQPGHRPRGRGGQRRRGAAVLPVRSLGLCRRPGHRRCRVRRPAVGPADWHTPLPARSPSSPARSRDRRLSRRVLARDGATVVGRHPGGGESLARNANRLGGTALQLDVPHRTRAEIVRHARGRHGSLDVMVHNAGITRDKLLANMDESRWASVVDVNVGSVIRMNEAIRAGRLADGGHVVCVSSIAGSRGEPRPDQLWRPRPASSGWSHRAGGSRPARPTRHGERGSAGVHRDRDDGQDPAGTRRWADG